MNFAPCYILIILECSLNIHQIFWSAILVLEYCSINNASTFLFASKNIYHIAILVLQSSTKPFFNEIQAPKCSRIIQPYATIATQYRVMRHCTLILYKCSYHRRRHTHSKVISYCCVLSRIFHLLRIYLGTCVCRLKI